MSSLFPAYAAHDDERASASDVVVSRGPVATKSQESLDWLENPSFQSSDAGVVHTFHQEAAKPRSDTEDEVDEHIKDREAYQPVTVSDSDDTQKSESDSRKRKKHRSKKRKHTHKEKHKRKKSQQEDKSFIERKQQTEPTSSISRNKTFLEEIANLTAKEAFRIDRTSDKYNLQFESLYKSQIARHRRACNCCLGQLAGHVVYYSDTKKELKHSKQDRYYYLVKHTDRKLKPMTVQPLQREPDSDLAFVPLGDVGESVGVPVASTDSSETTESSKTAEYNRRLLEEPNNIKLWLKFIDIQDNIDRFESKASTNLALLEIKLAIFDKALEKNPASVELKMARLDLCKESWEKSKLFKEWDMLTFKHPNNTSVWQNYLRQLQSDQLKFTVPAVMKAYSKCFTTLNAVKEGTLTSHPLMPGTVENMIGIFTQLTCLLKQAGLLEKAIGMWQALIEFNLLCPEVLRQGTHQEKLGFLEMFWDSSAGRVGEREARGWAQWVQSAADVPDTQPFLTKQEDEQAEDELLETSYQSQTLTWLSIERSRSQRHWLPWRPTEQDEQLEDCEDPERIVLFDDVRGYVFSVDSPQLKFLLLCSYLQFLGMQIPCVQSASPLLTSNRLLLMEEPRDLFKETDASTLDIEQKESKKLLNVAQLAHNTISQCKPCLTADQQTVLTVLQIRDQLTMTAKPSIKDIKRTMKGLLKEESNRNNVLVWDAYGRLLSQLGQHTECRKVLETALSMLTAEENTTPGAIRLYRTYSELELALTEVVHKPPVSKGGKEQEASRQRVLHTLCRLAEGDNFCVPDTMNSIPPNRILSCRLKHQQRLELVLKHQLSPEGTLSVDLDLLPYMGSQLEHWTVIFALFQYVSKGVDAASAVFQQVQTKMQSVQTEAGQGSNFSKYLACTHEILTQAHCNFLYQHITHNICPRSVLRQPLLSALQLFPDNTDLLQLLVELECPASVAGQHRRCFKKLTAHNKTAVTWLFAVLTEYRRAELLKTHQQQLLQHLPSVPAWIQGGPSVPKSGSCHQLRAWFDRAVTSSTAKHHVLLWRLYFFFEIKQGDMSRAKGVFYRSLQHCPWAKAIYMDYVQCFPDQLQEVIDLMSEKELRIHFPLEEMEVHFGNGNTVSGLASADSGLANADSGLASADSGLAG